MKIVAAIFVICILTFTGSLLFAGNEERKTSAVRQSVQPLAPLRFEIDPAQSKFMVKASRGGLAWFKGHDHLIAVRDFSGHAELSPDVLDPAAVEMTINAGSLEETSDAFTAAQKGIINNELKEIVLETAKYPEITFKSTAVKGAFKNGVFETEIDGDITLHGVTRHIVIPATVSVEGSVLHARGKFSLDRSNFNVKATSAFHGFVRVKNKLKFTFDIVGRIV